MARTCQQEDTTAQGSRPPIWMVVKTMGPFWVPYTRCRIILRTPQGTIIFRTTHMPRPWNTPKRGGSDSPRQAPAQDAEHSNQALQSSSVRGRAVFFQDNQLPHILSSIVTIIQKEAMYFYTQANLKRQPCFKALFRVPDCGGFLPQAWGLRLVWDSRTSQWPTLTWVPAFGSRRSPATGQGKRRSRASS